MGQPTPPGDIPLYDGLGTEWNDILSGFPEDRRAEFGPKIKERLAPLEPLKQWEDFQKSGITPDHAANALNVYSVIENKPREVLESLAQHLGVTIQEAKQVVKEIEQNDSSTLDPELAALKQQVNTLAQIALAQREAQESSSVAAQQDKELENEINDLRKKYGDDFPEDEILMRMLHMNLSAEDAYTNYMNRVTEIQKRRPSPFVMGSGGAIPREKLDVKKLDSAGTKGIVAQMLSDAIIERQS